MKFRQIWSHWLRGIAHTKKKLEREVFDSYSYVDRKSFAELFLCEQKKFC